MSLIISIVAFVIIFSILVLIHEFGHFMAAKRAGIKVEEFGIGLPPRAMKLFKKGDTWYTINWIPFGGFVRMLGEDDREGKANNDPKSFQNKTIGQRMLVICAGVIMNFILAFVLLTIGFVFGMEPIMVDLNDVMDNVRNETIYIQEHAVIRSIPSDSVLNDHLQEGDQIMKVNGKAGNIIASLEGEFEEGNDYVIDFLRDNTVMQATIKRESLGQSPPELLFYDFTSLPFISLYSLPETSPFYGVLEAGDIVMKVDGIYVFSRDQFLAALQGRDEVTITVLREDVLQEIIFSNSFAPILVYNVDEGSLAEEGGLEMNDILLKVNDVSIRKFQDISETIKKDEVNSLVVNRNGEEKIVMVKADENGRMGVMLSLLHQGELGSFTSTTEYVNVSITGNKTVPIYLAPVEALSESYRLTYLTVGMLGKVVSSLFMDLSVPEGVAGPVGIWQLTDHYAKQGFIPLMRLCALLSLSLAVINIMPFPALDGGRLVFLVYEAFTGRKPNQNVEGLVHLIGFVLLLLLLFIVTYKDLVRIFE